MLKNVTSVSKVSWETVQLLDKFVLFAQGD